MEEKKKAKPVVEEKIPVTVNFRVPPKMPSVTAQHVFVQDLGDIVHVSFFEVQHPLLDIENETRMEQIRKNGIDAECVARVNIPRSYFPSFVDVFSKVLKAQKKSKDAE